MSPFASDQQARIAQSEKDQKALLSSKFCALTVDIIFYVKSHFQHVLKVGQYNLLPVVYFVPTVDGMCWLPLTHQLPWEQC